MGGCKLEVRHLVCPTVGAARNRQGCAPDVRAATVMILPSPAAHRGAVQSPVSCRGTLARRRAAEATSCTLQGQESADRVCHRHAEHLPSRSGTCSARSFCQTCSMGARATAMPLGEVILRHLGSGATPVARGDVLPAQPAACPAAATGRAAERAGARGPRGEPAIPTNGAEGNTRVLRSGDRHGLRARREPDRLALVSPAAQISKPVEFLAVRATCDQHDPHSVGLAPAPRAHESPRAPAPLTASAPVGYPAPPGLRRRVGSRTSSRRPSSSRAACARRDRGRVP